MENKGNSGHQWIEGDGPSWQEVAAKSSAFNQEQARENVENAKSQMESGSERIGLLKNAIQKIRENPSAVKVFKELVVGALLASMVVVGAKTAVKSINNEKSDNVRSLTIEEVEEDSLRFMNGASGSSSEDLSFMTRVEDENGKVENIRQGDHGVNEERGEFGNIVRVDTSWYMGEGDVYCASDIDGDGLYDRVERVSANTGESEGIELSEGEAEGLTWQRAEGMFD